jgi:hypothetical protein
LIVAMSAGQSHLFFFPDISSMASPSMISNIISSSHDGAKENDGSSPFQRQRRFCRIMAWLVLAVIVYQIFVAHFLGGMVPDIEVDKITGRKRVRRRPERLQKMGPDGKMRKR